MRLLSIMSPVDSANRRQKRLVRRMYQNKVIFLEGQEGEKDYLLAVEQEYSNL